jgi:hypothetical protein
MAYLSRFILKPSITARRSEINNPACSVKSPVYLFLCNALDFKVLLIAISEPQNKLLSLFFIALYYCRTRLALLPKLNNLFSMKVNSYT